MRYLIAHAEAGQILNGLVQNGVAQFVAQTSAAENHIGRNKEYWTIGGNVLIGIDTPIQAAFVVG